MGHARVAGDGDGDAPRRAVRAALARRRPGRRRAGDEPEHRAAQRRGREKDTKTHQHRRIALDPETVEILVEHRQRCASGPTRSACDLSRATFVFSRAPDGSTYLRRTR